MNQPTTDPRTEEIRADLDAVAASLTDFKAALFGVNDEALVTAFRAPLETGAFVVDHQRERITPTIADDIANLFSQFKRHPLPREDPDLGRLESLSRLRSARGNLYADIEALLDAAARLGLTPRDPAPTAPSMIEFESAGLSGLLGGLERRLGQVEEALKTIAPEGEPGDGRSVQQVGLVNFYIGSISVEIALARLETLAKDLVDFASLARAVESMSELTRDFLATLAGMRKKISEGLRITAHALRPVVGRVTSGLRAIVHRVRKQNATNNSPQQPGPPPGPAFSEQDSANTEGLGTPATGQSRSDLSALRQGRGESKTMTTLIVDGSNLCLAGQKAKREIKTLGALLPCLRALLAAKIPTYVIFDASFRHRIDKRSRAAAQFEALLKRDDQFQEAPAGTEADAFILQLAALRGFGVLSNDTFRDYVTWTGKGKDKAATLNGIHIQVHSFMFMDGCIFIPSLGISDPLDGLELSVDEIIAARRQRPSPSVPGAPSAVVKSKSEARPAPAKPVPSTEPQRGSGELDALIELSPLMLRAGDVFEAYRRLTGKPWKARNSSKTAEAFAEQCFSRPVGYRDVEGRKKNDGYFFDSSCADAQHDSVRAYVTSKSPKIIPLIASARTRLVPILDLIHDEALAGGFTLDQLCARADALKISYYERYLRAALYALIAVNGVLGENEKQTDISTILKGRMRVNPDESSSDRLNFLQRGILYLLSDQDNVLPDLIKSQMGWMLQLPTKMKIHDAIVRGHMEWLAQITD